MPTEALLLGIAQDAGVPQPGCDCVNCDSARRTPAARQRVACLALIDRSARASWLIDATPDFPAQLDALRRHAPECPLKGILITHAHIGHYLGLAYLGREGMNAREMPVYTTPTVGSFLANNGPWSQLVAHANIRLVPVSPDHAIPLSADLSVIPTPVPHRAEFGDTMAYLIAGTTRRLFYCPDIDRWSDWSVDVIVYLRDVDVALLDATFFDAAELPGRNLAEIPHPFATDTAARLAGTRCDVRLIHLNHTNPLLREGPERAWVEAQGLRVGHEELGWSLG